MIQIKIKDRGDLTKDLRNMSDRARALAPVSDDLAAALVRQNERVNFDPQHPQSILESDGASGRIGARSPRGSYADVLEIDEDELGDIQKRYIVDGSK